MYSDDDGPDAAFTTEFGKGEFSTRLWRGGLRTSADGYTVLNPVHVLSGSISNGLEIAASEKAIALIDSIETLWEDGPRMRRACQPLRSESASEELNTSTLVRVLLCIDSLQPPLVNCIVNKISEFGEDIENCGGLALLLLSQLKWLDFISDSPALCESLLSIVQIVSPQMQRNIVESLPEILDDRARDRAVKELISILSENPAMTGSVVDALGALGVNDDCLQEVNTAVLSSLSSAHRDMLPASLRYLMRSAPPVLFDSTVAALRETLAQQSLGLAAGRLCLDALRSGFRLSKNFADHIVKYLRKIESAAKHRPADIWIILALLDSPAHRKTTEVLFRKKAALCAFSNNILDAALAPFADSFIDLHDRLICMAAIALKAQELSARKTAVSLYTMLFRLFKLGNARRNIVGALLEHTGSRRSTEIDAALDALVLIAKDSEHNRSLLPHSAAIQGLLDFLETFSDSQLRKIWTIMALLCRSTLNKKKKPVKKNRNVIRDSQHEEMDDDDDDDEFFSEDNQSEIAMLEILVRKELTHVDISYRRIGVLGASTLIKVLGAHIRKNFFKMLFDAGRSQAFTQALAFDELGNVLPVGDPVSKDTIEHISSKVSSSFEAMYIGDAEAAEDKSVGEDMPASVLWANYDGPDVDVCVPIYRLIVKKSNTIAGPRDIVRPLAPGLRLLGVLTALRDNGLLHEIDAVIGAPMRMPDIQDPVEFLSLSYPAKRAVLLSFFAAHGWVVELINGFSNQPSAELRAKCIRRLENLIYLEEMLSLFTARFLNWTDVLFDAYQGVESLRDHPLVTEKSSGRGRKPAYEKNSGSTEANTKNLSWKKCARKLEPEALSLLQVTSPITYTSTDFETEQVGDCVKTVKQTMELNSKTLHYLLSQLLHIIEDNIQQDLAKVNSKGNFLSATIMQSGRSAIIRKSSASAGNGSKSSMAASNSLELLTQLKPAVISLTVQLARSLRRCMPAGDEEGDSDDLTAIKLFRECAIMCLKCLTGILSMSAIRDPAAQGFLFDVLASIHFDSGKPIEPSDPLSETDIHMAAKMAFGQLRSRLVEISSENMDGDETEPVNEEGDDTNSISFGLEGSAAFLAALESVFELCSDNDKNALGRRLSDVSGSILEQRWGDTVMKSKRVLKLLPGIVRLYIQCAESPMELTSELRERLTAFSKRQQKLKEKSVDSQEIAESVTGADGLSASQRQKYKGWGSLTAHSYHVYCMSVFEQYVKLFKVFKPGNCETTEEAFTTLSVFITGSMNLYDLARNNGKVLGAAMRSGRLFVEEFIKSCLPFLKENFAHHRKTVLRILKSQQKATRLLQVFCAHSKSIRETSLTTLVPPLRRSLELLLYRVKEMLQSLDETGAYSLGNLKHRDINGEVVSSQEQYHSESDSNMTPSQFDEDEDENDQVSSRRASKQSVAAKFKERLGSSTRERTVAKPKEQRNASFSTTTRQKATNSQSSRRSRTNKSESSLLLKSSGYDHHAALPKSDADDEEIDNDDPLVHSLAPHNDAAEGIPMPQRKKRKTGKSRARHQERSRSSASRRIRKLIDDEADESNGLEDEADEHGNLSGFVVDDLEDDDGA